MNSTEWIPMNEIKFRVENSSTQCRKTSIKRISWSSWNLFPLWVLFVHQKNWIVDYTSFLILWTSFESGVNRISLNSGEMKWNRKIEIKNRNETSCRKIMKEKRGNLKEKCKLSLKCWSEINAVFPQIFTTLFSIHN